MKYEFYEVVVLNCIKKKNVNTYIEEISKQIDILFEPIPEEYKNIDIEDLTFKSIMREMRDIEDTISCLEDSVNE